MIIPVRDKTIVHIYRCGICEKYFGKQTGDTQTSCAVFHSPGQCCHHGEREHDEEKVLAILDVTTKAND